MKKLDKLTLLELQELGEFQDHIGLVIEDLSNYEEFIPKSKKRKYQKCYDTLLDIWQTIEQNIEELCDGDKRYLKTNSK
jgi:hypothetical protein